MKEIFNVKRKMIDKLWKETLNTKAGTITIISYVFIRTDGIKDYIINEVKEICK